MTRQKTRWLLAALLWLALWPAPVHSQSAAITDAHKQFSELYEQGRYQEALPFAEKALRLGKAEFGLDHPYTASFLNNLADLYRAQGRYGDAEPLHKRSLAIRKKALGPEHPAVAQVLENYAVLLRETGHPRDAAIMAARATAIRAKRE